MDEDEIYEKLRLELRRGALVLAVLASLTDEHYGYSLRKQLNEKDIEIDEGTLYPLIRRLEKQGLLESEWREESKRKKRFYRLSALGQTTLTRLLKEWQQMNNSITTLVEGVSP